MLNSPNTASITKSTALRELSLSSTVRDEDEFELFVVFVVFVAEVAQTLGELHWLQLATLQLTQDPSVRLTVLPVGQTQELFTRA